MYKVVIKPCLDRLVALVLLILLFPLFGIVTIIVFFNIGQPVLFVQRRPGKDGKIFNLYKFRSMTNEKDKEGNLLKDEKRLQTPGKLLRQSSLDELPQLINVIKGDMSFIGPRPLLEEYLPLYNEKQQRRHEVKPGITGWAQVNGRNAISWEKKFDLDVWYVDNISFLLDVKIFFLTILKVIRRSGIASDGSVTIEKFKGSK